MYREPISRPESNGSIESGFPNNDQKLPAKGNETGKTGFRIRFLHTIIDNAIEPVAYKTKGKPGTFTIYPKSRQNITKIAKNCET